jgi:hypothetical protein
MYAILRPAICGFTLLTLTNVAPVLAGPASPLEAGRCFLLIEETFQRDAVYECGRSRDVDGLRSYGCVLLDRDGCPAYGNFSAMMYLLDGQVVIARQDGTESFDCVYLGRPTADQVSGAFSSAQRYTGEPVADAQSWRAEAIECHSRCRR